ncbi:hypothetical protein BKA81DRAFT_363303 [Phyllosticta paracitricarpa]
MHAKITWALPQIHFSHQQHRINSELASPAAAAVPLAQCCRDTCEQAARLPARPRGEAHRIRPKRVDGRVGDLHEKMGGGEHGGGAETDAYGHRDAAAFYSAFATSRVAMADSAVERSGVEWSGVEWSGVERGMACWSSRARK